jgi:SagB-type dehydrogenase family enzyme
MNLAYKRYPATRTVSLPHPPRLGESLEDAVRKRRSRSTFGPEPIELWELSKLLELGAGVTHQDEIPKRAAPSGGALYPVETYVIALGVAGLQSAAYHYSPLEHALEEAAPVAGMEAVKTFLPPGLSAAGPKAVIALSVIFGRTQMKYLERGYRFALIEVGHIAQNLLLGATAMGLATVPVGGFWDEPFNKVLRLDGTGEAVVYSVLVGRTLSERAEH